MDSLVNRFSGEQMILASAASDDLRRCAVSSKPPPLAAGRATPRRRAMPGTAILTRNYARLLEFCHLVGAAERIDRRHGYAGVFGP